MNRLLKNIILISTRASLPRYLFTVFICLLVALICLPMARYFDLANIVMLFLLSVALVAVVLGKGPAIVAAFLNVALFDFLFVPPRFSFAVQDGQYLVTFVVMLVVALMIGHLTTVLQKQLHSTQTKEEQVQALYEYACALTAAMSQEQVMEALEICLSRHMPDSNLQLFLPDADDNLHSSPFFARHCDSTHPVEQECVNGVYQHGDIHINSCGQQTDRTVIYLPLRGTTRMRGVLTVSVTTTSATNINDKKTFLQALASLTVTALERLHFADIAQKNELEMQSERLRNSILSALSHDIRTPLTVLCGLADTIKLLHNNLPADALEMLESLRSQAFRLENMVGNLLDMARLQSGKIRLNLEWQPIEEVIGSSIRLLAEILKTHSINVDIHQDMPLLNIDAVLLERVLCNLLENAHKYSDPNSTISISAAIVNHQAEISVRNECNGFPDEDIDRIFDIFERGKHEPSTPGFGMGLAICRNIVEIHGGNIRAFNPPGGGACVSFTLPLGFPPTIDLQQTTEPVTS